MKKLVALIISLSLILVPCFAYANTASGSALTMDEQLWIMNEGGIKPIQVAAVEAGSIKAASADNTPVFINGYAMPSSMNFYYFGSGSQATTFTNAYSQLPHLFQAVTYSIAYSTQNLNTKIQTALTTLNTAVANIKTGVADINGYSGSIATDTSNIYSRLGTMNTSLNNIKTYTDGVETSLTNILTAIQNQSLTIPQELIDDVDSINTTVSSFYTYPWGYYTYYRDHPNVTLARINNNGNYFGQSVYTANLDYFGMMQYWFVEHVRNVAYGLDRITGDVVGSTGYPIYNSDLTTSNVAQNSLWYDVRAIGSNLSLHLSRLAFVLANDDEIAARQAAASNTAAAVSNVISSSGSGSAKPSDISGIADLKSSVSDSISTGASASTVFNELGSDGDAWGWFSQACQDELSAPSRRSNIRSYSKSSSSDTPMLDAYYRDLEEALGFKLW